MFQNWQKTTYQTSSNRSKFMKIDWFDDVWYAVFYQFWNKNFIYFPQGYCQQNIWFYRDSKSTPKKLFFIRHTLEENKQKFCFKIDKKLHTKHHQINQFLWFLTKKKQVRYFKKCLYMVGQYNKVYWTTIPVYNIKGAKYKLWWAYLLNKQKTSKIFQKVFVYGGQYNKVYSSKSV